MGKTSRKKNAAKKGRVKEKKREERNKVHGTWYMVHGTWYMVHGTWYMVHGVSGTALHGDWWYSLRFGL
jgi:hypothetical protein